MREEIILTKERLEYINSVMEKLNNNELEILNELLGDIKLYKVINFIKIVKSVFNEGINLETAIDFHKSKVPKRTLQLYINSFLGINFRDLKKCFFINKVNKNPQYIVEHNRPINKRPLIDTKIRFKIFMRDQFKCVLCGSSKLLQLDHIIPVSKGGLDVEDNFQTLCQECNRGKLNKIIGIFPQTK